MNKFIFVILLFGCFEINAATLSTDNYEVKIVVNCAEGNVTCDDVTYYGKSKRSGRSISLKGETLHTKCADGITPCRFLAYKFQNGSYRYYVFGSGLLRVTKSKETLFEEDGSWKIN